MAVNDLSDDVTKQNHEGEGGQCHRKTEVDGWLNLRPPSRGTLGVGKGTKRCEEGKRRQQQE